MDYMRGYRVVFDDPAWMAKMGTAFVLLLSGMCIPLLGQIVVIGWTVEITRRDLRGETGLPPLPFDLEVLKSYLEPGLRHWLVQLAFAMPLLMLFLPLFGCLQFGMIASVGTSQSQGDAVPVLLAFLCTFPVFFGIGLVAGLFATYAQLRVAVTGELSTAFRFGDLLAGVRRIGLAIVAMWIVFGIVAMVLQLVGMLACFVGMFVTSVISMAANGVMRADLARLDAERGGPALPSTGLAETIDAFR